MDLDRIDAVAFGRSLRGRGLNLLVANVVLVLGLTTLPPAGIAFPVKLLLLLAVDGFALISEALIGSYQ